jgi:predicted DNA-binding transcriptional regulator YafY
MIAQQKILRVFRLIQMLKSKPHLSMSQLEVKLDMSKRSVFRYFNLLEELGFEIQKDSEKKYFIVDENEQDSLNFSEAELVLLKDSLSAVGSDHPLQSSLVKKLKSKADIHFFAENILQVDNAAKIKTITEALRLKCRLELENYHSINSNSISLRIVEPIGFDDNYESIRAIDIRNPEIIKTFKLNRAEKINLLEDLEQKHTEGKLVSQKDPFNFSGEKTISVQLILNHKTSVLLAEQYKKVQPLITKRSRNSYDLKVKVYSVEPLKRFVLANLDGVKIIRPRSLKKKVQEFYTQYIDQL